MSVFGFDAYSPAEIARRVSEVGVAKARLPFAAAAMLGVLAFSLGLLLVVVAGGEHLGWAGYVRNLVPVTLGNIVGGSGLVALVYHVIHRRGAALPRCALAYRARRGPSFTVQWVATG